ncbi:unnamed protein product [Prunus armeniaca]
MSFRLKNARVMYKRLVNKIFKEQISKTMAVYVDDMLVKVPRRADHIKNLTEAFRLFRKYHMKLNPSKCTFGVSYGQFSGCVSQKGKDKNLSSCLAEKVIKQEIDMILVFDLDLSIISDEILLKVLELPILVVLDEAYIEFSGLESRLQWVKKYENQCVKKYENLIVLRTFSKRAGVL